MVLHPEVQELVHEELERVAEGRDHVTMEDRARLPYVEATLNEIWRYCNVAPFGPPRRGRRFFYSSKPDLEFRDCCRSRNKMNKRGLGPFYFASIESCKRFSRILKDIFYI